MRLFSKQKDRDKFRDEFKAAQRERQVPVTADDLDEVTQICTAALAESLGRVASSRMTRGGIVVRGIGTIGTTATQVMRTALESVGYVLGDDFGRDGVVVTGWDPAHYSGAQLSVARIDDRIEELLAVRAEFLARELSAPAVAE